MDENGLTRKDRRLLKIKQKQMDRKSEGDGEPAFNIKAGHEMLTLKVSAHTVLKLAQCNKRNMAPYTNIFTLTLFDRICATWLCLF